MRSRLVLVTLMMVFFCNCKEDIKKTEDTKFDAIETIDKKEEKVLYKSKKDTIMDYSGTTQHIHAVKTQYYRWYQLYEREITPRRIENQMDILSDEVEITSVAGTLKGKAGYPERLNVYKGWKNAHHVQFANVKSYKDGTLRVDVEIIYQNIKPTGEKNQVRIAYDIYTNPYKSSALPKLNVVNLRPVEQLEVSEFKDAYPTNRVLALMHYWLFNIEKMDGNLEPFKAILADEFELKFSKKSIITNFEDFKVWVKNAGLETSQTNHFPENIVISELSENEYKLEVEFVWRGRNSKGAAMKAHTLHTWLIEDNIEEPFARIKNINVAYKEPFSVIEE